MDMVFEMCAKKPVFGIVRGLYCNCEYCVEIGCLMMGFDNVLYGMDGAYTVVGF